jgi:hypothetical protein
VSVYAVYVTNKISFKQALVDNPWLTDRWLRRAVHERRIPYFKVDGKLVFDQADLDVYVEAHRVEARAS